MVRDGGQLLLFTTLRGEGKRYDDLANYQPQWVEPLRTNYRGYDIYTVPPNGSGVALLLQMNILEGFDLAKLGHNTPDYLNVIAEVQRLGISDRNRYVADPEAIAVPVERLLSEPYAAERRALIKIGTTMPAVPDPGLAAEKPARSNTTHLSVADSEGNMVSLTQTLGAWFGSGVVAADTGVVFSNQMRHLHTVPDSPSRLGPGRRPRSNQSPVIVLKEGEPVLALGTPGTEGIWQRLVQVLVNVIDFKMDIQRAVAAPPPPTEEKSWWQKMTDFSSEPPRPPVGQDLALTIDFDLQRAAAEQLQNRRGAIVMLNPQTGEILAMASSPGFDPDDVNNDPTWAKLQSDVANKPMLNRAINEYYLPGSTLKTLTAAAGIDARMDDKVYTCRGGGWTPPGSGRPIRDDEGESHGTIGLLDAFTVSCNQYFAQLGVEVERQRMGEAAARFGLQVFPTGAASLRAGNAPNFIPRSRSMTFPASPTSPAQASPTP